MPRDYRGMIGGGCLLLIGGFAAVYALQNLTIGSLGRMGPGAFPLGVSILLICLGTVVLVAALLRPGTSVNFNVRPLAAISLAIIVFALTIRPFGMIPSVFVTTFIASRADSRLSFISTLFLALVLALGTTILFQVILRVPVTAIRWPL